MNLNLTSPLPCRRDNADLKLPPLMPRRLDSSYVHSPGCSHMQSYTTRSAFFLEHFFLLPAVAFVIFVYTFVSPNARRNCLPKCPTKSLKLINVSRKDIKMYRLALSADFKKNSKKNSKVFQKFLNFPELSTKNHATESFIYKRNNICCLCG